MRASPRLGLVALAAFAACGRAPLDQPVGTEGAGGAAVAETSVVTCGGQRCATNQLCCILDGNCIDPASAATTCPRPTAPPPFSPPGARPCSSNVDCDADEFCVGVSTCLGPGACVARANCGTSTGATFCGCDGADYPNIQTACRAGVTTLGRNAACGKVAIKGDGNHDPIIYCGRDDQCPTGRVCCPIYGRCIDAALPELCTPPPPGTRQACLTDKQCMIGTELCQSDAGCDAPGGCVSITPASCDGVLAPVCGCDGRTYTNGGCAAAAGTRVGREGACPPPPG
jgi:hypothetical protein